MSRSALPSATTRRAAIEVAKAFDDDFHTRAIRSLADRICTASALGLEEENVVLVHAIIRLCRAS